MVDAEDLNEAEGEIRDVAALADHISECVRTSISRTEESMF